MKNGEITRLEVVRQPCNEKDTGLVPLKQPLTASGSESSVKQGVGPRSANPL